MSDYIFSVQLSNVEGVGLFAGSFVPANTNLFQIGTIHPKKGYNQKFIGQFINHSIKPNIEMCLDKGNVYVRTIKNLSPGDELLDNYAVTIEKFKRQGVRSDFLIFQTMPEFYSYANRSFKKSQNHIGTQFTMKTR